MSVVLLATGGTIASTLGPDGRATATLSGAEVLDRLAGGAPAGVDVVDLPVAGSWNLGTDGAVAVARAALDAVARGASGVVVTHGTDVLEETAWVVELLVGRGAPVVLTGSMRHADDPAYEGPANLADALAVVAAPGAPAGGAGALVVLAGAAHAAQWVTKVHATAEAAFSSPDHGPVATVHAGDVRWTTAAPPPPPAVAVPEGPLPPVPVVVSHWDADGDLVRWHLDRGAAGLVVEATGAGNVCAALVPALCDAVAAGVPVVVASRCRGGRVTPVYGGPGGFAGLAAEGMVASGGLTAGKARVALQLVLADRGGTADDVAGWFGSLGAAP